MNKITQDMKYRHSLVCFVLLTWRPLHPLGSLMLGRNNLYD